MHEVTLKDIAKVVGCSVNTVSLALKDSPRISEATRKKIQKVAKEMDYTANNIARALVLKRTGTIGLIIRNISSVLMTSKAKYIERYLEQYWYTLYIISSNDDLETEEKAINLMLSNKVDGLLLHTIFTDNFPRLEKLRAQGFPIVLLSGFRETMPKIDAIYPNLVKGAYIGTRHLLQLGHKRVAFVGATGEEKGYMYAKYQGYAKAMEEAGVEITPDLICSSSESKFERFGDQALGHILKVGRTESAMFIDFDEIAIPIIKFLTKNGIRIPQDLAIVSMDNVRFAEWASVPLTTAGYDIRYISHHAVDILLGIINGTHGEGEVEDIAVEPDFYIRESCGYHQVYVAE